MSETSNVDSIAAEILADQRTQAQKEAALSKATIAVNANKALGDEQLKEGKLRLFRCTMPNSQFVTRAGKYVQFPDGIFTTNDPLEIAELEYEIARGHPHIFIDKNNVYVDDAFSPTALAERARLKEEVRQEVLRDMGYTTSQNFQQAVQSSAGVQSLSGVTPAGANPKLLKILNSLPKATG